MYMVDFFYDNASLVDDFDGIIGSISSNTDEAALGSERSLNTVKIREEDYITDTSYDNSYTTSFDIIQNPCHGEIGYTDRDIYRINMWLNKKGYKKFRPIYDDDSFPDLYFMATFTNVTAIKIGDKVMGFHLDMVTSAPYGFTDIIYKKDLTPRDNNIRIYNDSQEEGYLYPSSFKIKCRQDGNLILRNDKDKNGLRRTIVNNVVFGETLEFNGEYEIITADNNHPNLFNDFNYNFPRLYREPYQETMNTFTLDEDGIQNADIEIKYAAIRRVGVIL